MRSKNISTCLEEAVGDGHGVAELAASPAVEGDAGAGALPESDYWKMIRYSIPEVIQSRRL